MPWEVNNFLVLFFSLISNTCIEFFSNVQFFYQQPLRIPKKTICMSFKFISKLFTNFQENRTYVSGPIFW